MYTFSSRLKTFSLILMAVGLLGIGYGFYIIAGIIVNCRANEIDTGD